MPDADSKALGVIVLFQDEGGRVAIEQHFAEMAIDEAIAVAGHLETLAKEIESLIPG